MTPRNARSIQGHLTGLAGRISRAEARLDGQYAQRLLLWQAGRSVDPTTGQPFVDAAGKAVPPLATFAELAEWSGVSEPAIHKAMRKARDAVAAGTTRRGRYR